MNPFAIEILNYGGGPFLARLALKKKYDRFSVVPRGLKMLLLQEKARLIVTISF